MDRRDPIKTTRLLTRQPDPPLSTPKARRIAAVTEEELGGSEVVSLALLEEGIAEHSRIRNGPPVPAAEGVNTGRPWPRKPIHHSQTLISLRKHRLATTPMLPTTITPFGPQKIYR